jgi:hypothetical protein
LFYQAAAGYFSKGCVDFDSPTDSIQGFDDFFVINGKTVPGANDKCGFRLVNPGLPVNEYIRRDECKDEGKQNNPPSF